ncbi:MAG: GAF domain-containing sensor histidine kinase [Chloroflexota bacterium]|nr:GAF domain-containing sensor histidine kinase [Chloroflexota bacterium]
MRLRVAGFVLPSLLIVLLVALDFVLEPLLPTGVAHLVLMVVGLAGVLAFSSAIFGRFTELYRRDEAQAARLRAFAQALEQRRAQMQALNIAGMSLTSELDTVTVLQRVVDQARAVASAKYAALGVFDSDGLVEQFITSGISDEERARIGPLPHGLGLLGLLQKEQVTLRLRDIHEHPSSVGFPEDHPPMRSFLGTPIVYRGVSLGNLYLTEKQGAEEFSADDEEAVRTLAAQAAIAIENARLYEQIEQVSAKEERNRIGMDLHDGVIQSLYGVSLQLEDAADRLVAEPEASRKIVDRAVDRLNASIADLRSYVLGLRPVRGSDRPLTESLSTLAAQARTNAFLEVDVAVAPEAVAALDDLGREAAFYIAADALGNVQRHARARRASLRLFVENSSVVLEIGDDGVGFDHDRAVDGHGLRNMRERAFSAGGRLSLNTEPGRGSRVRFEMPVREEVKT